MAKQSHEEAHSSAGDFVRDSVIGVSDGLTVPFALAAGLAGAVVPMGVIVTAGIAEIAAGSIAMGLGGFLAARGEAEHYAAERAREELEINEVPAEEEWEVEEIFREYGVEKRESQPVINALRRNPDAWADFMMRFELGLNRPVPGRALRSALTIALSYIVGGILPLLPYMLFSDTFSALVVSIIVTMAALAGFGAAKSRFVGAPTGPGALKTLLTGAAAATAAYVIARLIS